MCLLKSISVSAMVSGHGFRPELLAHQTLFASQLTADMVILICFMSNSFRTSDSAELTAPVHTDNRLPEI